MQCHFPFVATGIISTLSSNGALDVRTQTSLALQRISGGALLSFAQPAGGDSSSVAAPLACPRFCSSHNVALQGLVLNFAGNEGKSAVVAVAVGKWKTPSVFPEGRGLRRAARPRGSFRCPTLVQSFTESFTDVPKNTLIRPNDA